MTSRRRGKPKGSRPRELLCDGKGDSLLGGPFHAACVLRVPERPGWRRRGPLRFSVEPGLPGLSRPRAVLPAPQSPATPPGPPKPLPGSPARGPSRDAGCAGSAGKSYEQAPLPGSAAPLPPRRPSHAARPSPDPGGARARSGCGRRGTGQPRCPPQPKPRPAWLLPTWGRSAATPGGASAADSVV
ncbi:hypothetical protein P7K49_021078 [Saguinus oedipus]|uniref:Basic proline-rich protein-like n=1 Tax=Saguinus oedipus TaxID=9490 RepID=A0ABQ9USD7_SAGOE|nr:hypothetical protein P7K49_021078 [Saguinus oedipus]